MNYGGGHVEERELGRRKKGGVMGYCPLTRREALLSLPALAAASKVLGQSGKPPIRVRALNHMTLTVSDRQRSVEFYQGLFGLPVQHRQGVSTGLRIGSGPQYISLAQGGANAKPAIAHFCMTVDSFQCGAHHKGSCRSWRDERRGRAHEGVGGNARARSGSGRRERTEM